MLDETWNVNTMSIYNGERDNRNEPFNTIRDTAFITSGTMFFEKESEVGIRQMLYTAANGETTDASFIVEADVQNDNPTIEFIGLESIFPETYIEETYKVISFDDSRIELFMEFYGTGDLTLQECSIILTK